MADRCRRIADSGVFQGFILVVIVLNAITLGIQPSPGKTRVKRPPKGGSMRA
jgi:hypothetical protein